MRHAIHSHRRDVLAIVGLILVALLVAGFILGRQRFSLPHWVPGVGSDVVTYRAELSTAQSITPGQGQTVDIAGVPVGDISDVRLQHGRAVVSLRIRRRYAHLYRDATALLRPKTGLNDMVVELTPGSRRAGVLDAGRDTIPIGQTLPNVNTDEFLAALDADTRNYLKLLIAGGGQALGGNGRNLSAALRRFQPTSRDLLRVTRSLASRRGNVARVIHNFRLLTEAVGGKDRQLAALIDSSNRVFRAFAGQDARLRETLRLLPSTLSATDRGLTQVDRLGRVLGPTLGRLRPGARALGPSLEQARPFFLQTTPVIRNQLRPFARDALPTVRALRPAARDLAALTPDLTQTLDVVNYLLDTLTYNPKGRDEGYLFWLSWLNHIGPQLFRTQDAHGLIRHGAILFGCSTLQGATAVQNTSPASFLATIIPLTNPVPVGTACGTTAGGTP